MSLFQRKNSNFWIKCRVIFHSYQDTFGGNTAFLPPNQPKFICPDSPRTCIDSYIRQDGCEECTAIGCVAEDGTKHLAGSRFADFYTCYFMM